MKASDYRKLVVQTSSIDAAKKGVRVMASNRQTLTIGLAIVGVATEVGELMAASTRFLIGVPMNDDVRAAIREQIGDAIWYAVLGAKALKVKLPSTTKKIKPTGTMTELILAANNHATRLLSAYKKMYSGKGLGLPAVVVNRTDEEVAALTERNARRHASLGRKGAPPAAKTTVKVSPEEKLAFIESVREEWAGLINCLYQLSWSTLGGPIGDVMDANEEKIATGPEALYKDRVPVKKAA